MAQALNSEDIDQVSQPLNPGGNGSINNNDNNINNNNNNPNANYGTTDDGAAAQQPQEEQKQSTFSKVTTSIKVNTMKGAQFVSEKSKDRLSMEGQLKQARLSLEKYVNPKFLNKQINEDTTIPKWVLKRAKGLVFLTVIKAGFLFAGNIGTGCIIIRKPNGGWTGPSSIGVAGVSFGLLAGASKVDYIMILPDDKAVKQFTGKGQLRLGGEIQLAVGPIGRDGSGSVGAGDKGVSVIYSYSHAQGLYGGLALDGKVISVRPECNKKFYKRSVSCAQILGGNIDDGIPNNEDYDMIIHLLDSYCLDDDMTPIKGEKLSIDDLNKDNEEKKEDPLLNDSQQQQSNNNNNDNNQDVMSKISSGFGKFTSSVSSRFLSLTGQDSKDEDKNKNKENVKLQESEKQQNKPQQQQQQQIPNNVNNNNNANVNNNANYQIGDYDAPDLEEE
eukprot:CAMPEP_0201572212 /NCGR_PEP_ID=MMETSP0190_2-20130828/15354_1 /ASSEMBLY_ACC=CAM_ASM_000263 /TAXON_ID=37353 /ORGANISM="Rosalina sp." /LENGTH=443 /DNA_ID=CAMNT_0047997691 /DNA_START=28 /DNA_END=1359 /DNA_ORIENTATION=+